MDKTSKSLVTGATGLIGPKLVKALRSSGEVVVAARDPKKAESKLGVKAYAWDGKADIPAEAFDGVDTVFHLAGEPVANGRWNDEKKRRIRESRVVGTRALVRSMAGRAITLISSSAVGYYGTRGDEELVETSPPGEGFLAEVCIEWEREAALHEGGRVAIVRTGVVLSPDGGALGPLVPVFKLGVGGRVGDGKQWMPWIHMADEVGLFLHARDKEITGPMCASAPLPVTNADFSKALGHALHRPSILPAPAFAVGLALGEMAQVITNSQRVLPKVAEATGYVFEFRDIDSALADLFSPAGDRPGQSPAGDRPGQPS